MSFGVCLFLQGVIRKYGRKTHTLGLQRDINMPRNFLPSRRLQKLREGSGAERGQALGARPVDPGARPHIESNQDSLSEYCSTDLKDQG